eukprot:13103885-Heterocapsa_arctica.AAC.1
MQHQAHEEVSNQAANRNDPTREPTKFPHQPAPGPANLVIPGATMGLTWVQRDEQFSAGTGGMLTAEVETALHNARPIAWEVVKTK